MRSNILRLLLASVLVGLIAAAGCLSTPTGGDRAVLKCKIGINGHSEIRNGVIFQTAPYIVTLGTDTIGAYWTLPEAIASAKANSK